MGSQSDWEFVKPASKILKEFSILHECKIISAHRTPDRHKNFSENAKKRGIKVDRPTPLNFNQPIATPDWKTKSMFGTMPARDIILTVGKEMLEATMSYRCRFFEYLNYRPLLKKYYDEDPGMRHESAPKPRLTDKSFHLDYLSEKIGNDFPVILLFKSPSISTVSRSDTTLS